MASQEFTVLYTHQKMKKAKTWQDGILRVRTGRNQATLFDEKGQCLESIFIKSQVTPGDDFESERYLITVEAVKVSEKPSEDQPKKAETAAVDRNGVKPGLLPPRHLPVGLKRKVTGFQGPRQVEKKIPAMEDEEKPTVLPFSNECHGSFPFKFYISSPLFSTIRKKDAETNPSAGCQEEVYRDNGREQVSVSSLLSAPFSDSCEETEKQNSNQFVVKPESPLLTGHAGPGAVSHHIRSTAQIIALLKSKPAQGHREQASGVTGCLSRFQAAENADLCDKKRPVLPAFSGDPAKGLVPDTQRPPFMQGTVNDKKDWNAQLLPNSAEQPCGEGVTGQRQDKKPKCVDNLLQKAEACIVPIAAARRDPGTSDWQPKSPGSRSLHKNDADLIREGNFRMKPDVIEEPGINQSSLALDVCPEVPAWTMSRSPSDLRQAQWAAWEPGKISSEPTSPLDPGSTIFPPWGNEETIGDIREPLTHGFLRREAELPDFFFTREKSSYPEECSLPGLQLAMKTRTPFITLPATNEIPDVFYPTESEEVQQSSGSSGNNLCSESVAFPRSAPGPEDRNYETSVFGEYMEDGQREPVPPMLPNAAAQHRQSKWLKYQSGAQCDLIPENSADGEESDDSCAQSVLGMPPGDTGEGRAMNPSAPSSAPLLPAGSPPGECSRAANTSHPGLVSEGKVLSLHLRQTPLAAAAQKVLSHLSRHAGTGDSQDITISELSFPPVDKVKHANLPKRKISIPAVFQSHTHYKQVFKAALTEQLNIMLFELAQRLHNALSKVDISFYTAVRDGQSRSQGSCAPLCNHMHPAKLVMVKKEGQNKGRLFYACDAPKAEQCSFFKWIEDVNPTQAKSRPSAVLRDTKSIGTYLRSQKIAVYEECQLLVRKAFEIPTQRYSKFKKFMNTPASFDGDSKPKLYLKLSRKEHSSLYSKDDIWVVSKTLNFDPIDTFIASSAFFGPSSNNEIELLPLKGYSPSNWRSNMCVHALLVCNASGELASLRNMEEHFNPSTLPLIPYLLKMNFNSENATKRVNKRKFTPPAMSLKCSMMSGPVSSEVAMGLAEEMIQRFSLNPDQAASLIHVAQMMTSCENPRPGEEHQSFPITIIRGVFGAGKSYLLSVVILFLVQLFESSEATEGPRATPWKLLIASSTNVAVDRILLGLLDLGFEDFIRVGSIRKITKAILPHSLHAGSGNENEQLKELLALMKEDLTPAEKIYVRKSIEQHKLGTNKTILQQVKVVGVTCAACPFPCLNALRFPVVMLDECSQMTEPASLLPIARFQCEKLVLVGDPKQLPPTIQGSESIHEQGLEQTLFDRLCLMGHNPVVLRTQYRCHPALSAIASELFYGGNLVDGISEEDRTPLLEWLPTLCFYSVHGMEQIERDNSFYNMAEAHFTVKLIQSLIASGIEGAAIGVITLYKSQMYKIQNLLSGVHSEAFEVKPVQVSTVDAFQGAEREVIVLSCVRTRQFGFIDSERRMNVALTRAKRHLLIVGSLPCLSRNRLWGRVIHHCRGWENGLQQASQCEQQLNDILKSYLENWEEEEQSKKKEK
ncbi:protein ZGRF1 isoform X3 [Hirundo rustica]|uniref:protein ZGRF1 isoform X3 n=1 Tax=Hirundo rustica TaxID=43150 RepID=UPI001A951E37|nr:protein ZGRF1 isoform X3 [Hirundo rustica]XP_039921565.1 protein ZGRF1 isoform X3 [Hirundo rustica]